MRIGDKIKLHYERENTFYGDVEVVDGEFVVIGVTYSLPHCFGEDSWSPGFNSFEYGEHEEGKSDIVRVGSIFVPTPDYLDKQVVKKLVYDKKTVSWEVLEAINKLTKE